MKEILESLRENIVVVDRSLAVLYANASAREALLLVEGVPLGARLSESFDLCPEVLLRLEALAAAAFESGKPAFARLERASGAAARPDAGRCVFDVSVSPVFKDGQAARVVLLLRNVAEAVKIEEILERYAEGLTVLYEISSVFLSKNETAEALEAALGMIRDYYSADLVHVAVPVNGSTQEVEFLGAVGGGLEQGLVSGRRAAVSHQDMLGRCLLEGCPTVVTDFSSEAQLKRPEAFAAQGVMSGICVPMMVEGSAMGILSVLYKRPMAIDTAELWYMNVAANTLAVYIQKERSLDKLRESESFLTSVLEGIGEGVAVIGPDYRLISVNNGFLKSLELESAEEVLGRHCYEVSHREAAPCYEKGVQCTVRGVYLTGRHHAAIHTHYKKDGSPLSVETNAYPVKDYRGNTVAVVETLRDVTGRVRLEKDLEKRMKELEEFYEMAVGRELRMIELKEEVQALKEELDRYRTK